MTTDHTNSTSIENAIKNPNSTAKCTFSGNLDDGYELIWNAHEWLNSLRLNEKT